MLSGTRQPVLILLGLAVFASVVLRPAASMPWVPDWLGAAIAGVALLGTLMLFWHASASLPAAVRGRSCARRGSRRASTREVRQLRRSSAASTLFLHPLAREANDRAGVMMVVCLLASVSGQSQVPPRQECRTTAQQEEVLNSDLVAVPGKQATIQRVDLPAGSVGDTLSSAGAAPVHGVHHALHDRVAGGGRRRPRGVLRRGDGARVDDYIRSMSLAHCCCSSGLIDLASGIPRSGFRSDERCSARFSEDKRRRP